MSAHPTEPHTPHTHLTRWPHQLDYPSRKPHQFRDLYNNPHPHNPSCVHSGQNSVLTQVSDSQSWRQKQGQRGAAAGLSLPSLLPLPHHRLTQPPSHSLSLPTFTISFSKFLVYVSSPLSSTPPPTTTPAPNQRVISSLSFLGRSLDPFVCFLIRIMRT